MEEREAEAAGRADPRARADSALTAFAAGLSGDVSWSVYDPEEDEGDLEPAADDPKPRGMDHPATREAAREGKRRHKELDERVQRKGKGWDSQRYFRDESTGRRYFLDVTTPERNGRFFIFEYKPNTPSGRAAGEKQCAEYTRVTGMRCRVIYYQPPSNTGSRTGGGIPKLRPPWGVGSTRHGNPKLFPPLPVDPFE